MSDADLERPIDLCTLSGALAMRRSGFTDAEIARLLGYLPPLHLTTGEVRAALARQRNTRRPSPVDDEGQFLGDL